MTAPSSTIEISPRLHRLLSFLERDPGNLPLLADTASVAFDERQFSLAAELIGRYKSKEPLPAQLVNLQGLLALADQRFEDAAEIFRQLQMQGHDEPGVRFNLAWAMAMTSRYEDAAALLDDETIASSPRGPALKIQLMHHLGQYDEAIALGQKLAQLYPNNQGLMGTLATLAMDAEQADLARQYAARAGEHPEGLAAQGMFALDDEDTAKALPLFERAIEQQPRNPRAWVGKGLSLLAIGDLPTAAKAIDRGAELFEDHPGSWIASGWAHFMAGDRRHARASFERALASDPNFAESHGGLAVLDLLDGELEQARKRCDTALRLDRASLGGTLAKSMLLNGAGDKDTALKIINAALSMPIGPSGKSIAQALAGFSMRSGANPDKSD